MSAVMTACFFAGLVLLVYGAWLMYVPAGFVVAGLVLLLLPVRYVRGKA